MATTVDIKPIDSLLGVRHNGLFEELAEEAKRYMKLVEELKTLPEGDVREKLEAELYGSIVHLVTHGSLLQQELERMTEAELSS